MTVVSSLLLYSVAQFRSAISLSDDKSMMSEMLVHLQEPLPVRCSVYALGLLGTLQAHLDFVTAIDLPLASIVQAIADPDPAPFLYATDHQRQ